MMEELVTHLVFHQVKEIMVVLGVLPVMAEEAGVLAVVVNPVKHLQMKQVMVELDLIQI
jgi:hypothetical protein